MNDVLKGNFEPKKQVDVKEDSDIENRFEKEALAQLGGSIAFVSKKKVRWDSKDQS